MADHYADQYDRPATAAQLRALVKLAEKWGKLPPKDGLTWDDADVAIRAMRNYRAMESKVMPDDVMQPGTTLLDWRPFKDPRRRQRHEGTRVG